ncbi:aspartyl/glutamyl-tRNA(Asn/Gln) amidotransferase subunit B [Agrobacterium vitis]|nr:aspartyl/glutamyl-tRNA(Asn/Gln) amidotransferase subunit B [Agrobacterium vitis]
MDSERLKRLNGARLHAPSCAMRPFALTGKVKIHPPEYLRFDANRRNTLAPVLRNSLVERLFSVFPELLEEEPVMTLVDTRTPDPKRLIPGATGDWEIVIGMEVHAQVTSNSKLFSGASTTFGNAPNSNVSLVDAAMPGMLPVINEECVAQAVRTGLGLKAQINKRSIFDRKNYFYPDLPQGYQISQFKDPIVGEGKIIISLGPDRQGNFEDIEIGIERLHLEQDAGKSMHDQHPTMSYVDLNRSGVALMEIVSKPDMRSSDEAKAYMTKLRSIVRYLGTCDGNMDEGSMRADVNVSVRKPGGEFGTRCEIKNVNSIRFIGQAIEYEARRQIAILEDGGVIDQETRLFDAAKGETRSMRSKEDAHDYRYFPDPDLLPLEFDDAYIAELKKSLPELPDDKKARFVADLGLSVYDASILVSEKAIADYYEAVAEGRDGKTAANWVINDLLGALNKASKGIEETPVSPAQLGGIIDLIKDGTISGKIAKDLFEIVWNEGGDPAEIVESRGMKQVTDTGAIEKAVDEIIAANPDQVAKVLAKPSLAGWFVGQVMKATGGKANPQAVQALVKAKLGIEE